VDFCEYCGGLLMPQKSAKTVVLTCRKCGRRKLVKSHGREEFKLTTRAAKKENQIIIVDKKAQIEVLPKAPAQCPKCEHNEAFWWMQQTRSADEPPTRFFRCTKCGHVWREYE